MEFIDVSSAIVITGDGFTPSLLDSNALSTTLGDINKSKSYLTPIASREEFDKTGFVVQILPDKVIVRYHNRTNEILPGKLKRVGEHIAININKSGMVNTGLGINSKVVIAKSELGQTGIDFCRQKFININSFKEKISVVSEKFVNTAKIVTYKDNFKITYDISPLFESDGEDLTIDINGHQNLMENFSAVEGLKNYQEIKRIINLFLNKVLTEL